MNTNDPDSFRREISRNEAFRFYYAYNLFKRLTMEEQICKEKLNTLAKECEEYGIPMSVLEGMLRAELEQEIVQIFEKMNVEDEWLIVDNFYYERVEKCSSYTSRPT